MKAIVRLNSGSSSIKFALFTLDGADNPTLSAGGKIERIGIAPSLRVRSAGGDIVLERHWPDGASLSHADLLKNIFAWAAERLGDRQVIAIGHRVVHGGAAFAAPRLFDDAVLDALQKLSPLAPLHQPHNLAAIRAIAQLRPELPQVACFDTAFHHDKPVVAARLRREPRRCAMLHLRTARLVRPPDRRSDQSRQRSLHIGARQPVAVLIIPTDEERMITLHTLQVIG